MCFKFIARGRSGPVRDLIRFRDANAEIRRPNAEPASNARCFKVGRITPVRAIVAAGMGLPALVTVGRLCASAPNAFGVHSRSGCEATAGLSNALQLDCLTARSDR